MIKLRPPALLDVVLAGGLAALGVAQVLLEDGGALAVLLMLGMTLPVALRRAAPLLAVVVGWFLLFAEGGFGLDVTSQGYAAILALWITVYSVARHGRGSHPAVGLVWAMACVIGSVLSTTGADLASLLLTTVVTVAPWLAGYVVRRAETGRARAEDDAGRERAAAEQHAVAAVAVERARIAREVHDVLGHTLGLMVLQLGAAEQAMETDPDRAREAVRSARSAGKSALAEVRYLIDLQEDSIGGTEPPTRGLSDISELVATNRRAGIEIELDLDIGSGEHGGQEDGAFGEATPSATDLAAYRIVQESLTNALRHGDGPVRVGVRRTPTELSICVHNTVLGRSAAGGAPVGDSIGRGIIGMTERARSCGGSLTTGEVADGFLVQARLPVTGDGAGLDLTRPQAQV